MVISRSTHGRLIFSESSSDEDMSDSVSDRASPAIVEEPDDPAPPRIELDDRLKGFLERARQSKQLLPTSLVALLFCSILYVQAKCHSWRRTDRMETP